MSRLTAALFFGSFWRRTDFVGERIALHLVYSCESRRVAHTETTLRRGLAMTKRFMSLITAGLVLLVVALSPARAEELAPKYRKAADKGLAWLVSKQFPYGHWEANGGNFATAMTGMAGTALLMEGSTIRE